MAYGMAGRVAVVTAADGEIGRETVRLLRGRPEEVAAAISFLRSTQTSLLVGTKVCADGGSVASV